MGSARPKCPVQAGESVINLPRGQRLVFSSFDLEPAGVCQLRVIDAKDQELVMWESTEWRDDPECVMGAILGVIMHGAITQPLSSNRRTS